MREKYKSHSERHTNIDFRGEDMEKLDLDAMFESFEKAQCAVVFNVAHSFAFERIGENWKFVQQFVELFSLHQWEDPSFKFPDVLAQRAKDQYGNGRALTNEAAFDIIVEFVRFVLATSDSMEHEDLQILEDTMAEIFTTSPAPVPKEDAFITITTYSK
jgi:hypothetical protein